MFISDLIFPKFCAGCGKWGKYLCLNCQRELKQSDLVCPNCERPSIGGVTHPLCYKKYGLDGLWSLGIYQDPLKSVIQKLKYKFVRDLASELVEIIVVYWAKNTPDFFIDIKKDPDSWVIVPVPLHPKRECWRGFNQSSELAKLISKSTGIEYKEYLKRIKNTKPQMKLLSKDRRQNIKNAFVLSEPCSLYPANCLLVDDVWTTGSTLKECCYVLKKGGVKKVWALTIAR